MNEQTLDSVTDNQREGIDVFKEYIESIWPIATLTNRIKNEWKPLFMDGDSQKMIFSKDEICRVPYYVITFLSGHYHTKYIYMIKKAAEMCGLDEWHWPLRKQRDCPEYNERPKPQSNWLFPDWEMFFIDERLVPWGLR